MNNTFKITIITIFLFGFFANSMQAQKIHFWIDAGVKFGAGPAYLYNKQSIDDVSYNPKINTAYGAGAKVGFNFGEYHAFTFDGMYHFLNQSYDYTSAGDISLSNKLRWQNTDLYLLYRYNRSINFVELGGAYSLPRSILRDPDGSGFENVDNLHQPFYSGVFGFGWRAIGGESFTGILGFRLSYALTDFVNPAGVDLGHPFNPTILAGNSAITSPATFEINFELNWGDRSIRNKHLWRQEKIYLHLNYQRNYLFVDYEDLRIRKKAINKSPGGTSMGLFFFSNES